jgi:hypothetical protein
LQASNRPSRAVARCTWPSEAAAAGVLSKALKRDGQPAPSSAVMRRLTKAQPMGGASDWSWASSAAYSGGNASGMVASSCATFIMGPFRPPSARASSAALSARSNVIPSAREPIIRAATPLMPAPTLA